MPVPEAASPEVRRLEVDRAAPEPVVPRVGHHPAEKPRAYRPGRRGRPRCPGRTAGPRRRPRRLPDVDIFARLSRDLDIRVDRLPWDPPGLES
jgi:hypothetical protein